MSIVAITHDLYDDGSETVATYSNLETLVATAFPTDEVMIVPNDGNTVFLFRSVKDEADGVTVTLEGQKSPQGATVDDVVYTLADAVVTAETLPRYAYVGPKNPNLFNVAGGYCQFTCESGEASNLKYAAIRHLRRGA